MMGIRVASLNANLWGGLPGPSTTGPQERPWGSQDLTPATMMAPGLARPAPLDRGAGAMRPGLAFASHTMTGARTASNRVGKTWPLWQVPVYGLVAGAWDGSTPACRAAAPAVAGHKKPRGRQASEMRPTDVRHLADRRPTCGRQTSEMRPTCGRHVAPRLSCAAGWPGVVTCRHGRPVRSGACGAASLAQRFTSASSLFTSSCCGKALPSLLSCCSSWRAGAFSPAASR